MANLIDELFDPNIDQQLNDYIKKTDEAVKSTRMLVDEVTKLLSANQKLSKSTETRKKKREELNVQQKAALKVSNDIQRQQQRQMELNASHASTVQRLNVKNQERLNILKAEARAEGSASDSLVRKRIELSKLTKEYDRASTTARTKMAPAINKLSKEIQAAEKATNRHQRGVGDYASAFGMLSPAMSRVATGVNTVNTSFKVLLANPLILALSVIVGAVAALAGAFTKTQAGADKVNKVFAQIGAIVDVVIERLAILAKAAKQFLGGEWTKAAETAREATKGFVVEAREAAKAAADLEDYKIELFEDETEFIKRSAERKKEIQDLILITRDYTKSYEERRDALIRASDLEKQELAETIELQKQRIEAQRQEIENTPELQRTREQNRKLAEQEAQLNILIAQSTARTREIQNRLNEQENRERAERLRLAREEAEIMKAREEELASMRLTKKKEENDAEVELETEKLTNLSAIRAEAAKKDADVLIAENQRTATTITGTAVQVSQALGRFMADRKVSFKDFTKELLQIALRQLQAEFVVAKARALIASIGTGFNFAQIAKDLAQIAAAQTAISAAQAVVGAFATGGVMPRSGLAITGERGRELAISPQGETALTRDSANIRHWEAGTTFIPNDVTEQILAAKQHDKEALTLAALASIRNELSNQRHETTQFDHNGYKRTIRRGNNVTLIRKKYYN